MIVVSDTNILSSLAAGCAFPILLHLFARSKICIPPGVHQELQAGLDRGKVYIEPVVQAIMTRQIEVVPLPSEEEQFAMSYPRKLNVGERQAIALAQICKATLLCNDRRATRYCEQQGIRVVNLVSIPRLLWVRRLMSQDSVRVLIERMEQEENLTLTQAQRAEIFAPPRRT